tara:strand:+ start:7154 stop:7831 length:678 start_codon:yes stop_codon:yes gene_type:complete
MTQINEKIVVDSKDGRTIVSRQNEDKNIAYILSAPHEYFAIDNSIGFFKFSEFYKFFRVLSKPNHPPEVAFDNNKILLSNADSRFEYIINDPSRMKTGPKAVNFDEYDYKFDFTNENLMELVKMHSMIKNSKHTKVSCLDGKVELSVYMEEANNCYTKKFDAEKTSEEPDELPFEFKLLTSFFEKIPSKFSYTVYIRKPGFMRFEVKHDDIELNIYTAKLKKGNK